MSRRRASWITTLVMVPIACLVALPFYYVVINTFKAQEAMAADPLGLPLHPSFANYVEAFRTLNVGRAFLNTAYVTAISVVLMLLIGALASFAMYSRRGRLNTVISVILLVAFLVPFQATIIPMYQMAVGAHAIDNLTGMIAI